MSQAYTMLKRKGGDALLSKHPVRWFVLLFVVYAITVSVWLFGLPRPIPLPDSWVGTAADPATFIPADELQENALLARIRDILYFLQTPFQWLVLLVGLFAGWFWRGKQWLDAHIKPRFLAGLAFIVGVLTLLEVVSFPFAVVSYALSRYSGVSNMGVGFWLFDNAKSILVSIVITLPVVLLLFFVIRTARRRWWLWMGVLLAPLMLFYTFIQPVLLAPLFNDFELLRDSELKADILALAEQADIPTDQVYEVNMSRRTNALNAYVTGIGSNARIVLWDTTLEQLSRDEILFTMAHEMGHYKMKHVYWGTLLSLGGVFITLFILYHVSRWLLQRFGWEWEIRSLARGTSWPVILLVFSMINFMSTPVSMGISRTMEVAADEYALEMTAAPTAGISGFQELARTARSETYPPAFIRWWRYTHPPISERLYRFAEVEKINVR